MSQESAVAKKKVKFSLTHETIAELKKLTTPHKQGELISALIQEAARHRACTPTGTAQPYPTIADQLRLLASQIDSSQST